MTKRYQRNCLSFNLRLLITPLVSCGHCIVCSSIYGFWLLLWYLLVIVLSVPQFTASDYSFGIYKLYSIMLYWVHLSWAGFECTLWSINIHCLLNTINMSLRKVEDTKGVIRSRKLRSVVFPVYSGFLHQWNWPLPYSWNIVESGVKHHKPNPKVCILSFASFTIICLEEQTSVGVENRLSYTMLRLSYFQVQE
jgi:hypothetical protein